MKQKFCFIPLSFCGGPLRTNDFRFVDGMWKHRATSTAIAIRRMTSLQMSTSTQRDALGMSLEDFKTLMAEGNFESYRPMQAYKFINYSRNPTCLL